MKTVVFQVSTIYSRQIITYTISTVFTNIVQTYRQAVTNNKQSNYHNNNDTKFTNSYSPEVNIVNPDCCELSSGSTLVWWFDDVTFCEDILRWNFFGWIVDE